MKSLRFSALQVVSSRRCRRTRLPKKKVSDYFGSHALGLVQMKYLLPSEMYARLCDATAKSRPLDEEAADAVAAALRVWAIEKGVTHYTHWFHPLTGATAEKHDTFFDSKRGIETLQSSALVQQEPDASSLPSGGIRSTFEARGYTAWDPSSPFFIWDTTLCIPTIFVSYTGDALDHKTPLLKSIQAVSSAATKLCKYFDEKVQQIRPMVGWEQEFFVVDRALYHARPDLVMCGRTLFGHPPARGQQLEDHYFGSISSRIMEYLKALEVAAFQLGIPLRTRHNEVAPAQYEVAPMFEEAQIAADHNQLLRDVMEKIARNHDLYVLFHEKPFAGLNGSGKHCNWSLITDTGQNLMQPDTKSPLFLIFFLITLRGILRHADLLRASTSSYGNDFRLGGNEAPPAIMSVFVGTQLSRVIEELAKGKDVRKDRHTEKSLLLLGVDQTPHILQDNTDRNRTSPFAFTGNKFELRAVGAEANISESITVLNALMAEESSIFAEHLKKMPSESSRQQLFLTELLCRYAQEVRPIVFDGDGYSKTWPTEAKRRGLSNLKNTVDTLEAYTRKSSEQLYVNQKILSSKEIASRYKIRLVNYIRKAEIEARLMCDLIGNHIVPTAVQYQNKLLENLLNLRKIGVEKSSVMHIVKRLSELLSLLLEDMRSLQEELQRIEQLPDTKDQAKACAEKICANYFGSLRTAVDELETIVDDEQWPLVKYRELLFLR